mgnify:CR=1 FL=1
MTAAILNEMRRDAMELSPLSKARMLSLRLSWNEVARMYYKYIGVLGTPCAAYRFEAVWHGRTVRTVVREPVQSVRLECTVHNPILTDGPTWTAPLSACAPSTRTAACCPTAAKPFS